MDDPIIRTAKIKERTAESAQNVQNDELISKKAAIEAHCELCEDKGLCGDICPDVEVFRLIPSAQPERAGKWKATICKENCVYYECSECKLATCIPRYVGFALYDYCPNCGARMEPI